jgi:Arc/MetJ family transcription regulator
MRTNIVIDDALMEEAMAALGLTTKRETVETALREVIRRHRLGRAIESLRGLAPDWEGDIKAMRADRHPDWSRGEG